MSFEATCQDIVHAFFYDSYLYSHIKTGAYTIHILNNDYDNNTFASKLAFAALDEVPTPKTDAKEIVGLVKSGDIEGVGVAHRKDSEYLKSLPDGTENNNLSNLPSVTEEEVNLK